VIVVFIVATAAGACSGGGGAEPDPDALRLDGATADAASDADGPGPGLPDAAIPDAAAPDAPCVDEVCDDEDNDCDGLVDEELTQTCGTDVGDCSTGVSTCVAGVYGPCKGEVAPATDDCDGGDEDCDGQTDEGCDCFDGTMQSCGTDEGACMAGAQTCMEGAWGVCDGEVPPSPETCNDVDDDCDASVDEDDPGGGGSCDTGVPGVCAAGTEHCVDGGIVCEGESSPSTEVCNGLDDDCDGADDDDCVPETATPRFPWNGYLTGSLWASHPALVDAPLRPRFLWEGTPSATQYELELDDSCSTPGFRTCDFATPELSLTTANLEAVAPTDLPVSTTAPVGRRYYWRLRACNASGCGAWSVPRYLDVGRVPKDVNGDGYSDLIAGRNMGAGQVIVYFGGQPGVLDPVAQSTVVGTPPDELGDSVAAVGDVNGDGFADVMTGDSSVPNGAIQQAGAAFVLFGGPGATLDPTADWILRGTATGDRFGRYVWAAGDVNGDGFADVGVRVDGAGTPDAGAAEIFLGGSGALLDSVTDGTLVGEITTFYNNRIGDPIRSAGDLDGDGICDLVVCAIEDETVAELSGRAFIHLGEPDGFNATPYLTIDGAGMWYLFCSDAAAGDFNRDGFSDLAIGAERGDLGSPGAVYILSGGVPFDATFDAVIFGATVDDWFARHVGAFDYDGDGYIDVISGSPGSADTLWLFRGGPGAFDTDFDAVFNEDATLDNFVWGLASPGDYDGDGFYDLITHGEDLQTGDDSPLFLYLGDPSIPTTATPVGIVETRYD
jgi:hypothetical protein